MNKDILIKAINDTIVKEYERHIKYYVSCTVVENNSVGNTYDATKILKALTKIDILQELKEDVECLSQEIIENIEQFI